MIGRGTTVRVVCQKVDIHIDTYKGWLEKYPDFRERVKNAREQKAEEMLKIIEDISYAKTERGDVRIKAAERLLVLSQPENYGIKHIKTENTLEITETQVQELVAIFVGAGVTDEIAQKQAALKLIEAHRES